MTEGLGAFLPIASTHVQGRGLGGARNSGELHGVKIIEFYRVLNAEPATCPGLPEAGPVLKLKS